MDLAARRSARRWENLVMRLGCILVTLALLTSLVLQPPKAKAFALTTTAGVVAVVGGFLAACGLPFLVKGMDESGLTESVGRLLQEYFTAENIEGSLLDWAGSAPLTVLSGGKLAIPRLFTQKLTAFAQWVAEKYGTKAGENVVYTTPVGLFGFTYEHAIDDVLYFRADYPNNITFYRNLKSSYGELWGLHISIPDTARFIFCQPKQDVRGEFYILSDAFINGMGGQTVKETDNEVWYLIEAKSGKSNILDVHLKWVGDFREISAGDVLPIESTYTWIKPADAVDSSLSLDVILDTMQEVLDRLTALEEGQSVALDVGATESMEVQDILQGILDGILAGDLTSTAEVVDEAAEPVDPEQPPDIPVVPDGLDKLGAALTSRFPFSIPWDIYKGVTLLAAPAKAPYFEVDFFEPIGHLVGGWQGSTKIVLDMSEYEIIGQVCRWTSTIGFCLMLAAGTKRLIWTA